MKPDDGGPAFPRVPSPDTFRNSPGQKGMSLRDWFAGQALIGLQTNKHINPAARDDFYAIRAYRLADAMLKAREESE